MQTSVGISQWAMFRSAANFADPDSFNPERWIDSANKIKNDTRAFMPFSNGPRNCLGRSLAWAEIRIILAKIIWNFEILNKGLDYKWEEQLTFVMWEKKPLMIGLRPVKR